MYVNITPEVELELLARVRRLVAWGWIPARAEPLPNATLTVVDGGRTIERVNVYINADGTTLYGPDCGSYDMFAGTPLYEQALLRMFLLHHPRTRRAYVERLPQPEPVSVTDAEGRRRIRMRGPQTLPTLKKRA